MGTMAGPDGNIEVQGRERPDMTGQDMTGHGTMGRAWQDKVRPAGVEKGRRGNGRGKLAGESKVGQGRAGKGREQ
jgi:hypothetical protein